MGDERIANRELDCCANILGCEHEYTRPQLLSGYVRETRITLAGPLLSSHSLAERMDTSFPMRQFTCDSFGLGFVCCPKAWPNTRWTGWRELERASVERRRAPLFQGIPATITPVGRTPPAHLPSTQSRAVLCTHTALGFVHEGAAGESVPAPPPTAGVPCRAPQTGQRSRPTNGATPI